VKNSTVYQEKGLHNYIISCHRKHSGQHNRCDTRVAHDGKVGCHTVECTIAFLCKYVYHFLTNDTETFTRRNKVTLVSKWVVRFFFKRWRIVWRHRFKPACCILLDSDFSLISLMSVALMSCTIYPSVEAKCTLRVSKWDNSPSLVSGGFWFIQYRINLCSRANS